MKNLTAKQTLLYMVELFTEYVQELEMADKNNDFAYGEKTAYIECLEVMQHWKGAKAAGLDYEIEKRYPL